MARNMPWIWTAIAAVRLRDQPDPYQAGSYPGPECPAARGESVRKLSPRRPPDDHRRRRDPRCAWGRSGPAGSTMAALLEHSPVRAVASSAAFVFGTAAPSFAMVPPLSFPDGVGTTVRWPRRWTVTKGSIGS